MNFVRQESIVIIVTRYMILYEVFFFIRNNIAYKLEFPSIAWQIKSPVVTHAARLSSRRRWLPIGKMPVCMQPWMRFFHELMQWRILTVLIQIQTAWWSRKTGGGSAVVSNVHPEVASNFQGRKATAEKRDTHQPHDLHPYCILLQHFWHLVATVHLGGASIVLRVMMKALERLKICTWT